MVVMFESSKAPDFRGTENKTESNSFGFISAHVKVLTLHNRPTSILFGSEAVGQQTPKKGNLNKLQPHFSLTRQ